MTNPTSVAPTAATASDLIGVCATLAAAFSLPASDAPRLAETLKRAPRPSVIWLSMQECTGCAEALTRSYLPALEDLIFDFISLDYQHTLQAASGEAAELARESAMQEHYGRYLLVVDGSVPLGNPGYSTIAGISNLQLLEEVSKGAAAVLCVGTCAAYGGLPAAIPNPTGAVAIGDLVRDKPVINIPGCPPIPEVITGVIAYYLLFGTVPELDNLGRPKAFYGKSIHQRCYRRPFFERGLFAESFDDAGARKGWCLYKLGCKGPSTYNACSTMKWNQGVSNPVLSGHGCIGCSEPGFWDCGSVYSALCQSPAASSGKGV